MDRNSIEAKEPAVFIESSGIESSALLTHNQDMLISFALVRLSEDLSEQNPLAGFSALERSTNLFEFQYPAGGILRVPQRWLRRRIYGRA